MTFIQGQWVTGLSKSLEFIQALTSNNLAHLSPGHNSNIQGSQGSHGSCLVEGRCQVPDVTPRPPADSQDTVVIGAEALPCKG